MWIFLVTLAGLTGVLGAFCGGCVYAKQSQQKESDLEKNWSKPVINDDDIIGPSQTVVNTSATTPNVQPPITKKKPTVAKHYSNNEYSKETKKYH